MLKIKVHMRDGTIESSHVEYEDKFDLAGAKAIAREESKWESTSFVELFNPDGEMIYRVDGDFFFDNEKE